MPRSNQHSAAVARARALPTDWDNLVTMAATQDDVHLIKFVNLAVDPTSSQELQLYCFSESGHPLGTGTFKFEDSMHTTLCPYDADASFHAVWELMFKETTDDNVVEGIVLGIKECFSAVSNANLRNLLAQS